MCVVKRRPALIGRTEKEIEKYSQARLPEKFPSRIFELDEHYSRARPTVRYPLPSVEMFQIY